MHINNLSARLFSYLFPAYCSENGSIILNKDLHESKVVCDDCIVQLSLMLQ